VLEPGRDAVADRSSVYGVRDHDLVIVGTFDGSGRLGQADLVRAVVWAEPSGGGVGRSGSVPGRSVARADRPVIAVALREPFDLERYPEAPLCACTCGIQLPQMEDALLGRIPFAGTLPVALEVPA
jgi:beta-N-acetylhexosaminidase